MVAAVVELLLYGSLAFRRVHEWAEGLHGQALASILAASALIPWLIYTLPMGFFDWFVFLRLAALAMVVCFWFVVRPHRPASGILFVTLMAVVYLSGFFREAYPSSPEMPRADFLGKMMWVRLGIAAVLWLRREEGIGFGFFPTLKDWAVGARQFLLFLPVGAAAGFALGYLSAPEGLFTEKRLLLMAGAFFGTLLFTGIAEEFFFRGLLQRWLTTHTRNTAIGIAIAATLFGAAHLNFRFFPNWKFAILAALAGIFYGRAFAQAGNMRAAVACHTLTNTAWAFVFGRA